MEIEIIKNEETLLNMKKMIVKILHQGKPTPTKNEVKKFIAEKFKLKEELIDIVYLITKKGTNESYAKIHVKNEA